MAKLWRMIASAIFISLEYNLSGIKCDAFAESQLGLASIVLTVTCG